MQTFIIITNNGRNFSISKGATTGRIQARRLAHCRNQQQIRTRIDEIRAFDKKVGTDTRIHIHQFEDITEAKAFCKEMEKFAAM